MKFLSQSNIWQFSNPFTGHLNELEREQFLEEELFLRGTIAFLETPVLRESLKTYIAILCNIFLKCKKFSQDEAIIVET